MDELFLRVAARLNEIGISYMLSGSVTMGFYTIPRMTRDVDIVIEMGVNEVEIFTQSFQDFYIHQQKPNAEECST